MLTKLDVKISCKRGTENENFDRLFEKFKNSNDIRNTCSLIKFIEDDKYVIDQLLPEFEKSNDKLDAVRIYQLNYDEIRTIQFSVITSGKILGDENIAYTLMYELARYCDGVDISFNTRSVNHECRRLFD